MKYEIFEIIWICCLKICSKIDFSKILEILHETVISCESGPARKDSFFRNFLFYIATDLFNDLSQSILMR